MRGRALLRAAALALALVAGACSDATEGVAPTSTPPAAPTGVPLPTMSPPGSPVPSTPIPVQWQALARPLQLPPTGNGACPTSTSTLIGKMRALGDGPVRIATGDAVEPPTFRSFTDPQLVGRSLIKAYWLRDPSLRSPVLIRGVRLADRVPVRFQEGDRGWRVLESPTGSGGTEWASTPTC